MSARHWLILAGFVAVAEAAGLIGTVFTVQAIPAWYETLAMPSFAPPNWLFGPVWTLLYACMGTAAFLVWRQGGALRAYWVQLVLNALWTPIFFGAHALGAALIELGLLWVAIVWCGAGFYRTSRPAAWLLAPYLAWVSFAFCLNFALWWLN